MILHIAAHLLEFLLGPLFLLFHIPEFGVAAGELGQIVELAVAGDVGTVITNVLEGQFDVGTKTLASAAGTVVWVLLVASVFGEAAALGEVGELLDIFG